MFTLFEMSDGFSLGFVARRTGLSPQLIRTWEKRYNAVDPARDGGNRRKFDEEQVRRLELLRDLTQFGHRISDLSARSTAQLFTMLEEARRTAPPAGPPPAFGRESRRDWVSQLLAATRSFDAASFERTANDALVERGHRGFLEFVTAPLVQRLGELWRAGELKVAHEHFATAQIKTILGRLMQISASRPGQPRLVVTTPAEQWHELGALLVAAAAAGHGWNVTYLGASLAAEEIVSAAVEQKALAVALSIVYPEDDSKLNDELVRLRMLLPEEIAILAGGRAVPAYAVGLQSIGATTLTHLQDLYERLDDLRRPRHVSAEK
jgi:methylmalonyl-CoA mutase cobalamin-binding subunit